MKRGFTLIELLAVITVLGLILLIIIPKVTSMLKQSNKTTKEESVEMYGRAIDEAIATYFVKYPDEDNVTLQQLEQEHMVKYKGPKVSCQVSHIARRKAHLEKCTVNGELVNYVYGSYATLISDADNDGEISRGDKYSYEVNDTDEFNFYVLSIEGDNVNLIMDRNICEDGQPATSENQCTVSWYESTDDSTKGPIAAMTYLYDATKKWYNVPNMIMNYEDEGTNGYTSITTNKDTKETTISGKPTSNTYTIGNLTEPLKSRLPKISEFANAGCDSSFTYVNGSLSGQGTCPIWLVDNLVYWNGASNKYSINNGNGIIDIYGYWSLTSKNSTTAITMYYYGMINYYLTSFKTKNGVRAVITVSKSEL